MATLGLATQGIDALEANALPPILANTAHDVVRCRLAQTIPEKVLLPKERSGHLIGS
jgi:hypothetical protein